MKPREIKFRVYLDQYSTLANVTQIYFETNEYDFEGNLSEPKSLEYATLMQYTGLKDKHGNEIYEGDVLRTFGRKWKFLNGCGEWIDVEHISVIEWWQSYSNHGYRLRNQKGKTQMTQQGALLTMKAEIIGNIFENPELLNQ